MFLRRCLSLLVLALVLAGGTARAGETSAEYVRRSELGVQLYQQGRYRDALTEWLAAYSLESHPNLLLNIGQAYLQLEQPSEAIRYYVLFLQSKPHGKDRQRAQAGVDKARALEAAQRAAPPPAQPAPVAPAKQPDPLVAQPPAPTPVYKKAWFWGILGGVAAAGLAVGLGVGLRPSPPTVPDDLIK